MRRHDPTTPVAAPQGRRDVAGAANRRVTRAARWNDPLRASQGVLGTTACRSRYGSRGHRAHAVLQWIGYYHRRDGTKQKPRRSFGNLLFPIRASTMPLRQEATLFQRINPDGLNGRQKEIYNFQKSAALLADYGFNCIKLTDDWQGADFLAHHFDGATTLKVQLKARLTIDRKYTGQDLWMNFPCKGTWYLVPHDHLVELVGQTTNWLNTSSWKGPRRILQRQPVPRPSGAAAALRHQR